MQRLLSLAAVERLGIHRLHEVVNQEQEQAPKEDQAHHSQEDEAANEEGEESAQVTAVQLHMEMAAIRAMRASAWFVKVLTEINGSV